LTNGYLEEKVMTKLTEGKVRGATKGVTPSVAPSVPPPAPQPNVPKTIEEAAQAALKKLHTIRPLRPMPEDELKAITEAFGEFVSKGELKEAREYLQSLYEIGSANPDANGPRQAAHRRGLKVGIDKLDAILERMK
jgi:hypothetical protein